MQSNTNLLASLAGSDAVLTRYGAALPLEMNVGSG